MTGASKGIGKASALRLGEQGVNVAVNYNRSQAEAEDTVEQLVVHGVKAFAVKGDVSILDEVSNMVDEVTERFGQIDILVNNAGIINDSLLIRMSDKAWDDVITNNLNGTFYCTRAVLRGMIRRRWGRIINIGSVVGIRGNIGQVNYSASKAGIIGFTKALAKEVASRNITVNTVTPGYINTDTVDVLPQATKDRIMTWIPQGTLARLTTWRIWSRFIASEKARYMTGQIVSIDGGMAI